MTILEDESSFSILYTLMPCISRCAKGVHTIRYYPSGRFTGKKGLIFRSASLHVMDTSNAQRLIILFYASINKNNQ